MYLADTATEITEDGIRTIWNAAKRYHIASLQDANLYVAAKHNGYAVGMIGLLVRLASPEAVKASTGEDVVAFRREIVAIQDGHAEKAIKLLEKLKAKGFDPSKFDLAKIEKLLARL